MAISPLSAAAAKLSISDGGDFIAALQAMKTAFLQEMRGPAVDASEAAIKQMLELQKLRETNLVKKLESWTTRVDGGSSVLLSTPGAYWLNVDLQSCGFAPLATQERCNLAVYTVNAAGEATEGTFHLATAAEMYGANLAKEVMRENNIVARWYGGYDEKGEPKAPGTFYVLDTNTFVAIASLAAVDSLKGQVVAREAFLIAAVDKDSMIVKATVAVMLEAYEDDDGKAFDKLRKREDMIVDNTLTDQRKVLDDTIRKRSQETLRANQEEQQPERAGKRQRPN
jgi:hypothetical protein